MKPIPIIVLLSLSACLQASELPPVKNAMLDFLVGKRTEIMTVDDLASGRSVEITTHSVGSYDKGGFTFTLSAETSSPQVPDVVQKSTTVTKKQGEEYVASLSEEGGGSSEIRTVLEGEMRSRSVMLMKGVVIARWTTELVGSEMKSVGVFLDPQGKVVARSKAVTK